MKNIMCRILGHQEYDPGVLAAQPWEDPEFSQYELAAFREDRCLRCGEPLLVEQKAA